MKVLFFKCTPTEEVMSVFMSVLKVQTPFLILSLPRLNHVVTPLWNQPYSQQMEVSKLQKAHCTCVLKRVHSK